MPQRGRRRVRGGRGGYTGGSIRRFLEPVLLLLLHEGPSHGYELVSTLEPFSLDDVASGPVYRTLRELETAGLVRSEWDTESSAGPARRIYRLTKAGHRYLVDCVEELRDTSSVLHRFISAYDRHMKEGTGEYH